MYFVLCYVIYNCVELMRADPVQHGSVSLLVSIFVIAWQVCRASGAGYCSAAKLAAHVLERHGRCHLVGHTMPSSHVACAMGPLSELMGNVS